MAKMANIHINKNVKLLVYPLGTKFHIGGVEKKVHTVVDIEVTFNINGELKDVKYIATHNFLGQQIKSRHSETGIARGLIE